MNSYSSGAVINRLSIIYNILYSVVVVVVVVVTTTVAMVKFINVVQVFFFG